MRHALVTLFVLTPALVLALAVNASADDVHLVNGGVVEGKAARVGDKVIVETPAGKVELKASEVKEIVEGKTRHDRYLERRTALLDGKDAKSADAHVALGDWCKKQELKTEARRHWRRAVELDADHRAAHSRLGHIRHDGQWMFATPGRLA